MTREKAGPSPAALPGRGVAALVGRDRELGLTGSFLELAAAEGGALLLTGDPGHGQMTDDERLATGIA